ncbi:TPA: hypothetical protein ACJIVJ_001994 [Yersinia enterocolitica]
MNQRLLELLLPVCLMTGTFAAQAMTITGNVHPDRYTFFLNKDGAELLKKNNDYAAQKQPVANLNELGVSTRLGINIRWDGKAPVALTCVMSTDWSAVTQRDQDWTWCTDETGGEYIGINGWPARQYIAKTCKVGEADCPVYLSLQSDPPTSRNDATQFAPRPAKTTQKPKENTSSGSNQIVANLKADGCKLINDSIIKKGGSEGSSALCAQVTTVTPGPAYYGVQYNQKDGSRSQGATVQYEGTQAVWIDVPPHGTLHLK